MPTACDPCPGKRKAITAVRAERQERRLGDASREASGEIVRRSLAAASSSWSETSPAHESRAPGEAATERGDQQEITALDAARRDRFLERHVHRCGAGVPVAIHVDEDLLHRQADTLGRGLDDAQVRLV